MQSTSPTSSRGMPEEYRAGGTPLAAASIYQQLEKILASKLFHSSPQISRFLEYTVRHTLQGEGDQLKEYRVGVDIFGRRSSYDPHQDPVVRQEARRLRAKLREYYEDQGRHDPIRIDVPKGGYAATFAAHGQQDVTAFGEYSQVAPANRHVISSRKLKIGLTATISLAAVLLAGWEIGRSRRHLPDIGSPSALSVAVLPLRNLSGDPSQEYLADGITDSLIANLSRLPGLQVIARTTAFRYKGKDADPEKVGQDLHVNEVLTGTLLERGDMVIVQPELVDVAKNSLLWHAQYTRRTAEIQSVEGDIVRAVSERLERPLSSEQASQLAARRTDNTEAFQMYLMGRFNLNKRTEEGFTKAIEYFGQAIDKDPEYALAYAGRADCYILLAEYTVLPSKDALPQATAAATKALQLDDTLAEAHASLGAVKGTMNGIGRELRRNSGGPPNLIRATRLRTSGMPNSCHKRAAMTKPSRKSNGRRNSIRSRSSLIRSQEEFFCLPDRAMGQLNNCIRLSRSTRISASRTTIWERRTFRRGCLAVPLRNFRGP